MNQFIGNTINTKALLIGTLIILGFSSFAQEQWEEGGEIESVEIEIVKERQITLLKANRNFDKIPPRPAERIQPEMTYDFKSFRFATRDFQPVIKPLRLKQEELQKINGGYVSAGFGNFASPFLAASITSKRNASKFYGVDFLHRSFGKGPVAEKNSASGNTNLSLFTKGYNDQLSAGLQVGYENRATHFYGYQPVSREVRRDTIRQIFNIVSILGQVENVKPSDFNFRVQANFSYLDDYLRAAESVAGVHFKSDYKISDGRKFLLVSDYRLIARKDSLVEAKPRSLLRVAPAFQFVPIEKLHLTVGLVMAYENDTIGNDRSIHVFPDARASYELAKRIEAFAALSGDVDQVSLHSLTRENLWVNSNINIFHANKALDVKAGIRGTAGPYFNFQTGAAVSVWRHLYFFKNNEEETNKFDVVYDNATITNIFGEWSVVRANRVSVTMRADYFGYSMNEEEAAWHRPAYRVALFSNYNIFDKISLGVNFATQGGMKAFDNLNNRVVELNVAVDLNLKVRYFVSKSFSCYLEGNNLLNADYPLYFNYPVRGLQVSGGVSWSF
jgi:hypothetical protein